MLSINSVTARDDIFFEIWASQIDTLVPTISVQILLSFVDFENMSGLRVRLEKFKEAFQIQGDMCVYRSVVRNGREGSLYLEKWERMYLFFLVMRNRSDQLCHFENNLGAVRIIVIMTWYRIRLTFHLCLWYTSDVLP